MVSAKSVIEATWLDIYEHQREVLWWQLVTFNTNLFTLEKIETFPMRVFLPAYDDRIFWQTIRRSLVEAIIVCAWRIIVDKDKRVLTLVKFRDNILQHISDLELKNDLEMRLVQVDFDNRVSVLHKKIDRARQTHVAHLNREVQNTANKQGSETLSISLFELKELLKITGELFDVLCFDEHHDLWLWAYAENFREQHPADIDKLLDSIARNSYVLNLPEKEPHVIEQGLYQYTENELQVVNEYRRKFGLPEIEQH
jgi:hypothetical protein